MARGRFQERRTDSVMTVRSEACSCHPVKNPWTYYGIVEPGGAFEPDPLCVVHFPPRWKVACINWTLPDAPHAMTYLLIGDSAEVTRYHDTWAAAVTWLADHAPILEPLAEAQLKMARARMGES